MTIQTDVEETDQGNWIRIMAEGGFNTVGVKTSDSATAVFFRHLFKTQKSKNFMRPGHDPDLRYLPVTISGQLKDEKTLTL
jgi:hypothetical protein